MAEGATVRRAVAGLALLAVSITPLSARASTRTVTLTANTFAPGVLDQLVAGDTVSWNWLDGIHNVTAHQNGTFSSGEHAPTYSFSIPYSGGVVKYRCTIHSSLSGANCQGMCGILTDRPLDVVPPTVVITEPAPQWPATIVITTPAIGPSGPYNPVVVGGTAADDVAVFAILVRIYDLRSNGVTPGGAAKEYLATCTGCDTPSATWSLTVSLLPGSYVAEAIAADTSGNLPKSPPRAQFFVV